MEQVVTAASILFGFLFAGFWWALDRELKFKEEERHFKPTYFLLLATMALVAIFGVLIPLHQMAKTTLELKVPVAGIAAAVAGVFGYMLTELGHYSVYRKPLYYGPFELALFGLTVIGMILAAYWVLA